MEYWSDGMLVFGILELLELLQLLELLDLSFVISVVVSPE